MLVQTSEQRALLRVRENIRENHKTREAGAIIRLEEVRRALSLLRRSTVCPRTCDDVEIPSCTGENENPRAKKNEKKSGNVKFPVDIVS